MMSLREVAENRKIKLSLFFHLADQLFRTWTEHNDNRNDAIPFDPHLVSVHPKTLDILRWGLVSATERVRTDLEEWIYVSPEQTIRTSRSLDQRSGFYVLGMLFYRLLTGKYPYAAEGKSQWIHAHLAQSPIPAHEQDKQVPLGLSMLLGKLLSKSVDERYQTLHALEKDMLHCRNEYEQSGEIMPFPLARFENADRIRIPDTLYGRERELSQLQHVFQWTSLGTTQMVAITGPSGIGKTALVREAVQRISLEHAYVASGKFDQMQQDNPMLPLIQAFRELVKKLPDEGEKSAAHWRSAFKQALGSNGAVIAEVIPEIEPLIGRCDPVEILPPEESMKRFDFAFRRFIQVFCHQKHPLVLFLDDLQWVDAASWRIVRSMMTDPLSHSLLLLGAYREGDAVSIVNFADELQRMEQSGVLIHQLSVAPLEADDMVQLVRDTLNIEDREATSIADTLAHRTGGNSLLFRQWFQSSILDRWLFYDEQSKAWTWSEDAVDRLNHNVDTNDLLNYMVASIKRLPDTARQALLASSCLGHEFPLHLLSSLQNESQEATLDTLHSAMKQQLIVLTIKERKYGEDAGAPTLRFFHDRVREAAYSLLAPVERSSLHWRAGMLLLADASAREERLFEIAQHLNKADVSSLKQEDIERLVHLNAQAGRKAKSSTAYEAALSYLLKACEHVTEEHWNRDFPYYFELGLDLLGCAYISGHDTLTDAWIAELLRRARNATERTRVHQVTIMRLLHADKYEEGVALGVKCLSDLGIRVPVRPGKLKLAAEILYTRAILKRHIGQLDELPPVERPEIKAAMDVLYLIIAAAFLYDKEFSCVLGCKFVRLSLRNGNSPFSVASYGNFGSFLLFMGDRKLGIAAMKESLRIAENQRFPSVSCRIHLAFGASFFAVPQEEEVDFQDHLSKAISYGREAGDFFFVGHSIAAHVLNMNLVGDLKRIGAKIAEYRELLDETQNQYLHIYLTIKDNWSAKLKEGTEGRSSLPSDAEMMEQIHQSGISGIMMFYYYICRMQEEAIFGEGTSALDMAIDAVKYERHHIHYLQLSEFYLYKGLAVTSAWDTYASAEKKEYGKQLKVILRKLRNWAKVCPEHILHKSLMLAAEIAKVKGDFADAASLYDQAAENARRSGYIQHEAMANERAGRLYLELSRPTLAKGYLMNAYANYDEWGARGKAKQLLSEHGELLNGVLTDATSPEATAAEQTAATRAEELPRDVEVLDISIIQEAFQSIAGEADQNRLLVRLFRVILEKAGAQKGCIIVESAQQLYVEVMAMDDGTIVRQRVPLEQYGNVCLQAVHYSLHTGETVLLDHAANSGPFTRDAYVMKRQSKSLLCLPLPLHGRQSGVLYLENNLLPGTFSSSKTDMLWLLATQAVFLLKLIPQYQEERDAGNSDVALPLDPLTDREMEVLQLMSLGLSNKEIAERLHLVVGTVKLHINRIFSKMNVNRRTKAVHEAKRMNLLTKKE
ncbi:helix-turn-helix transcriptional regulator [Cohnella panacarvi]|uniref:helix-turn-helix transcriptional regulator n=1 Tax=Cohnella panacarvi TaxID=400776 RepID=UPI001FDF8BA8|nr:AAA family ATPase [Cohnella panacarvi]